jgi:hypothetical protein
VYAAWICPRFLNAPSFKTIEPQIWIPNRPWRQARALFAVIHPDRNYERSLKTMKNHKRRLVLQLHPDKNPEGRARFERVQAAFEALQSAEQSTNPGGGAAGDGGVGGGKNGSRNAVILLLKTQVILYRRHGEELAMYRSVELCAIQINSSTPCYETECLIPRNQYLRSHTRYLILHTPYPILLTPYSMPHTPYSILHTPYPIPHTPYSIPHILYSILCISLILHILRTTHRKLTILNPLNHPGTQAIPCCAPRSPRIWSKGGTRMESTRAQSLRRLQSLLPLRRGTLRSWPSLGALR